MSEQVLLITGCSRGLGRAFAESVLHAGHQVVATARNPEQVADLKQRFGDAVRTAALDVTSESQARDAVLLAIESFAVWTCSSTMQVTEMSRRSKILHSPTFERKSKQISLERSS